MLNCVGKQKIGKADFVLTSSCLNLLISSLTSSIYLMRSVINVNFTDIYAHASNFFFNIVFTFCIIETYLD